MHVAAILPRTQRKYKWEKSQRVRLISFPYSLLAFVIAVYRTAHSMHVARVGTQFVRFFFIFFYLEVFFAIRPRIRATK